MKTSKRILVAPLNWGLGHATRCIPIIDAFLTQGAEVILASDGRALQLLREEYPTLPCLELPSYDILYPSKNMIWGIAQQMPKITKAILKEQQRVEQIVKDHSIDLLVSDNRFGCYSKQVKSIFLTHQLTIKMPYPWLEAFVRRLNHYWIKKFDWCWVPDYQNAPNLSGDLGHLPWRTSFQIQYLGPLSRMHSQRDQKDDFLYKAIIILSGPEPQRTFLEELILEQLPTINGQFLVIQGKTEAKTDKMIHKNITLHSFMTSKALNDAICRSECVVCRSGYSSIMDLAQLNKKAVLIPTPGQTEQEYLAKKFHQQKIFLTQEQSSLDLKSALTAVNAFTGIHSGNHEAMYLKQSISEVLNQL